MCYRCCFPLFCNNSFFSWFFQGWIRDGITSSGDLKQCHLHWQHSTTQQVLFLFLPDNYFLSSFYFKFSLDSLDIRPLSCQNGNGEKLRKVSFLFWALDDKLSFHLIISLQALFTLSTRGPWGASSSRQTGANIASLAF